MHILQWMIAPVCRALEAEAQQVVEIIAPGPQGVSELVSFSSQCFLEQLPVPQMCAARGPCCFLCGVLALTGGRCCMQLCPECMCALQTSAKAWDQAKRQASADHVRAAIQNWKAQHQEHDHTAYTRRP